MKKTIPAAFLIGFLLLGLCLVARSVSAAQPPAGEEALFTTSTSPDALIVLDLSGSMLWTPAGETMYVSSSASCAGSGVAHYTTSGTGHTKNCTIDPYGTVPRFDASASCQGPFYTTNTGRPYDCRRVLIARRALFDILDDNDDNTINSADEGSLGVRIGYMRFTDGNDTGGDYSSGNNKIIRAIGSKYSLIYCANNTSCTLASSTSGASVIDSDDWPNSGTPLVSSLNEAKLYLDAHKAGDSARDCRQKFVILISDGADTYSCGGTGSGSQADMDRRRRESAAKAKELADAGYKVFVVGFGADMPAVDRNTLNWMAYLGGTDNPNVTNAGSTTGYDPAAATTCGPTSATNDPGTAPLSGYAFLAGDADELAEALKTAINIIRQANYSFSQASVQSVRVADENHLYEGSFEPVDDDPFWKGHVKKYTINADGTVGALQWDAGTVMQSAAAGGRSIKTLKAGVLTDFTTANITPADVGVATVALRDGVVGYIRGEAAFNPEQDAGGQVWKLGDVFRSTPITVGTPSAFFEDTRDGNNQWTAHRSSHARTSAVGNRLIVVGANDGQLHAVKTSNGSEAWSFIPPNLLTKLKNMTHGSHPTALAHQYFVDGPVLVADVWLGSGDGTSKTADWRTILVFGLGRGAVNYSWSSSSSCDSGISSTYSAAYPYYCGYWAIDLNDSLNPAYLWRVSPSASQAPYMGDSWSKMMTGRVRIKSGGVALEKWVGFIGAGYNAGDCRGGGACDTRGKGFFVVDLSNGNILWSYTLADNSNMLFSMPASPAIADTDNDGFIDTAYIGDMGGNMWRFKFCRSGDMPDCGISGETTNWSGGLFFDSSSGNIRPIYTMPAVAKDDAGNLWVYWGTGDKTDPTASNAQEHLYGVKDNDRTSTYAVSDIQNITTASGTYDNPSRVGYRILLTGGGQKMLADPTVFGGVVYFTTYEPPSGSNPCEQGGVSSLFAINYATGSGALTGGARSMAVGTGIASAPVVSLPPDSGPPDLYVTTSGGGGASASTQRVDITPAGALNRTNMLYWRDQRIQ
jgi:Tfp pilus tip-associated adhesin PilY1